MTLGVVLAVTVSVGAVLAAVVAVTVVLVVKKLRTRREENVRRRSDLTTKSTGFVVDWVEMPILRMSRPIEGTTRPWASAADLQHVYPSLEEEFSAPYTTVMSVSESHLPCLPQTIESTEETL